MSAPPPRKVEAGIGGFLLLFVLMQLFGLAMLLVQARGFVSGVRGAWPLGETMPFMRPALVVESLMNFVGVVAVAIGLLLLFLRREPGTRLYWRILLATTLLLAMLDIALVLRLYAGVHGQLTAIGASTAGIAAQRSAGVWNDVRLGLHAALWLAYWSTSKRVRLTFTPRTPTPA